MSNENIILKLKLTLFIIDVHTFYVQLYSVMHFKGLHTILLTFRNDKSSFIIHMQFMTISNIMRSFLYHYNYRKVLKGYYLIFMAFNSKLRFAILCALLKRGNFF